MFQYYVKDLSIENIKSVIKSYQQIEDPHCKKLFDYYTGKQDILLKEAPEGRPNNKICTNFCRQIADTYQGYVNIGGSQVSNEFVSDNLHVLSDALRDSLICGLSYVLVYYEDGIKKMVKLDPAKTVVLKDTTVSHNVIGACTWNIYSVYEEGMKKDIVDLYVYDESNVSYYTGSGVDSVEFEEENPHFLNGIPVVEIRNNVTYRGIFEEIISLQDSYNAIDSSYVDGRETFANSFLVISGMGVSEESATTLIDSDNKLLNLPVQGSSASYLIKPDNASDVIGMLENIQRRIFTVCSCPDFNDTKFGTFSGQALRHKLTAFINNVNNIVTAFDPTIDSLKVLIEDDFEFTYHSYIPTDTSDIVDMVDKLWDKVNHDLLLQQLPFVNDLEKARLKEEESKEELEEEESKEELEEEESKEDSFEVTKQV